MVHSLNERPECFTAPCITSRLVISSRRRILGKESLLALYYKPQKQLEPILVVSRIGPHLRHSVASQRLGEGITRTLKNGGPDLLA